MAEFGQGRTAFGQAREQVSGAREAVLMEAANRLMDARRTRTPLEELPAELRPTSLHEAYVVQDTMATAYGDIGGWKVGAPTADAEPIFAPMPKALIAPSGAVLRGIRYRGLEAEVAFLLGRDLPARTEAYTRDEVLAAVASCHPAIEVLESGLIDPVTADRLSMIADLQMHGAFLYGPAIADWRSIDFAQEKVTLAVDGSVRVEKQGSNTSGDLLRLLPYLANEGAFRTGGLEAGQWITTGSWTGNIQAMPHSSVDVTFGTLGRMSVRFEPEQELEKGVPGKTVRSYP